MEGKRPLWAPWRVEYIRNLGSPGCFLCGNAEENPEKPENELILYRGRSCYAMLNRYPYNSGHILVVPYRHVGDLTLLTADERYELMDLICKAEQVLKKSLTPDAFNVGFNLGKAAGAGLAEHLHCHVVPRWNGDTNFLPVLADVRCLPQALSETAELLREAPEWE